MKKSISIILTISILLCSALILIKADETETFPELEGYLTESIDNYFLPQGYDLSYDNGITMEDIKTIYSQEVKRNDEGKIIVPPVVTYIDTEGGALELYDFGRYLLENNYSESKYTVDIIRTFFLGNESAVRCFVAPWTLYNAKTGELYTFPELMEMDEAQLEALDFKTPDFAKFIANVKDELDARGWWKEEYQAKYDILYEHKDDYANSLDKSENFTIDNITYNFATLDYELKTSSNVTENNITCVNIFTNEFKDVYKSASYAIREKYSKLFEILDNVYTQIPYSDYYAYTNGGGLYYSYIIDRINTLNEIEKQELKNSKSEFINGYAISFVLFDMIENYGVSEEDIRDAIDSYNYIMPEYRVFGDQLINNFFNAETKKEALEFMVNSKGIIINIDKHIIMSLDAFTTSEFEEMSEYFDDPEYIISQIKTQVSKNNNYNLEQKSIKNAIAYFEELAKNDTPSTGDTTPLYLTIAAAALVSMCALAVRKRRVKV